MPDYLHNHTDFSDLIKIVADEKGIEPGLVEKDYWQPPFDELMERIALHIQKL